MPLCPISGGSGEFFGLLVDALSRRLARSDEIRGGTKAGLCHVHSATRRLRPVRIPEAADTSGRRLDQ
jgi:hypothetical protein